jgi:maltose-binding protein MalE
MAIKVNGTTVIDDSRNLSNVGGLKTVNGTSLVGSGNISAGASTTYGAVGTYIYGRPMNNTQYSENATASSLYTGGVNQYQSLLHHGYNQTTFSEGTTSAVLSGTWRCVSAANATGGYLGFCGLWVRIS